MSLSGDSLLLPIKCFLKILSHLHMIIMIIWMHGFVFSSSDPLIIPNSSIGSIGMIKFKLPFQIGSKNGGYILASFQQFFVLKSNHLYIILKSMLRV